MKPMEPEEQVVPLFAEDESIIGYAILDRLLRYWRSREPIDGDRAWTLDLSLRATFPTSEAARAELEAVYAWRLRRAVQGTGDHRHE